MLPAGPGAEPLVRGSGVNDRSPPSEAESFLRIGHPKEGANLPHARVLNDRKCNFGERGLIFGGDKGTILRAPEATNVW